jgi:hypothetical protein
MGDSSVRVRVRVRIKKRRLSHLHLLVHVLLHAYLLTLLPVDVGRSAASHGDALHQNASLHISSVEPPLHFASLVIGWWVAMSLSRPGFDRDIEAHPM